MGISRDRRHKHRKTGGRFPVHQKKRKFELGRPAAVTKLGPKRVRPVRCRGGNLKHRAIRLDAGNYCWASQSKVPNTKISSSPGKSQIPKFKCRNIIHLSREAGFGEDGAGLSFVAGLIKAPAAYTVKASAPPGLAVHPAPGV